MSYGPQTLAGIVLGTPLTFLIVGLYAQWGPSDPSTNFIAALYFSVPVWLTIMIWALKRSSARTAWLTLLAADLVLVFLVFTMRLRWPAV
ncbi:hypothetical protein [Luteibacter sp. CQ10]|uniref:hypothetical protein n=1 Tax=Luteibacter sp. CQ10 TaxID=2805821 RepID=UPI0034A58010